MSKVLTLEEQLKIAQEEEKKVISNSPTAKAQRKIKQIKLAMWDTEKKKLKKEIKELTDRCLSLGEKEEKIKEEARIWREETGQAIQKRFDEAHGELILLTDREVKLRNQLKELEAGEVI